VVLKHPQTLIDKFEIVNDNVKDGQKKEGLYAMELEVKLKAFQDTPTNYAWEIYYWFHCNHKWPAAGDTVKGKDNTGDFIYGSKDIFVT